MVKSGSNIYDKGLFMVLGGSHEAVVDQIRQGFRLRQMRPILK